MNFPNLNAQHSCLNCPNMQAFERAVKWVRSLGYPNLISLGKHYEVNCINDNELGKGGFSVVWKGTDVRTNDPVAVKQLSKKTHRIGEFVNRELLFLKECKHENVVKLFEKVEDDKSYFIIMEHCNKGDLDEFMKDRNVRVEECFGYMKDVTTVVKFLHGKGVCHRDIKPTNILMKDDGDGCYAKLADFGLARELGSSSGATATAKTGTLHWMAPEIPVTRVKCRYGLAVDIFSLGLVFLALVLHKAGQRLEAFTGTCICLFAMSTALG